MARQREVLAVPGCLPESRPGTDTVSAKQWRFESHRDGLGPTPERFGRAGAAGHEAGEGAHGRSIQASCCSDSSVLLYLEARRDKELLPKAGTGHDEEVAKVSLECLWAVR